LRIAAAAAEHVRYWRPLLRQKSKTNVNSTCDEPLGCQPLYRQHITSHHISCRQAVSQSDHDVHNVFK